MNEIIVDDKGCIITEQKIFKIFIPKYDSKICHYIKEGFTVYLITLISSFFKLEIFNN